MSLIGPAASDSSFQQLVSQNVKPAVARIQAQLAALQAQITTGTPVAITDLQNVSAMVATLSVN